MLHAKRVTESLIRKDHVLSSWNIITTMLRRWLPVVLIVMASAPVIAQNYTSDVNWLIDVLELKEGSVVADIGAGDGDQTLEIARYVGPEGRVYSTELGTESVEQLREAVEATLVTNVTVIEGAPAQTNLPEQCCDALFLRRVYHHFTDPASMNESLWHSLKPGGRLAVIDFIPSGSESADPDGRSSGSQHGVTSETVIDELRQAGFILISNEQRSGRDIYVVMEKPDNG